MTITSDHWLSEATRVDYPKDSTMPVRRFAVIHNTAGASAMSSIDWWKDPEAGGTEAHVVIDRDGTIYQVRAFNQRADHAGRPGKARWRCPRTKRMFDGLNSCTIGIELANAADDTKLAQRMGGALVFAKHRNGGKAKEWESYPEAQVKACIALCQALVKRYNLDDMFGHDDCAPERKVDPGPAFPMERLREACGFDGLPPVFWP
jgi:N-acetylmuramoyl-L-alanine amidase